MIYICFIRYRKIIFLSPFIFPSLYLFFYRCVSRIINTITKHMRLISLMECLIAKHICQYFSHFSSFSLFFYYEYSTTIAYIYLIQFSFLAHSLYPAYCLFLFLTLPLLPFQLPLFRSSFFLLTFLKKKCEKRVKYLASSLFEYS